MGSGFTMYLDGERGDGVVVVELVEGFVGGEVLDVLVAGAAVVEVALRIISADVYRLYER